MPSFDRVFGSFRSSSKYKDQQPSTNSEGALLFTDGKGEHSAQAIITETALDPGEKNLSEATQTALERVDVGIAESNPVSLPVTDLAKVQANLDLHQEKPETASLEITLARLEQQEKDITQPVYQLNNIKRQIAAIQERLAAQNQDKPEVIEETQVVEKVPAMEMHEVLKNVKEVILAEQASAKNNKILNEKEVVVTPDEAKLHELLQDIKKAPVAEKPVVMKEIAALKKDKVKVALDAQKIRALEEKRKEQGREKAGMKILQEENRIDALKKNIAAISADIKNIDDQIAHREPDASVNRRKKNALVDPVLDSLKIQSQDLKEKLESFEQRLKGSETARQEAVNQFLDLDGSEEQINTLIRENIEPEMISEKPVVIEVSDVAKEIALDVPQALAAGALLGVTQELVGEESPEQKVIQPSEQEQKVENLDDAIASARLAYVVKDVEMTNQWERLKRSFSWLEKPENGDLTTLRERYRGLLSQKQQEEIAKIALLDEAKRAGAMRELGMYFKVAEGAALASLYAEEEKKTVSGKLGQLLDKIGEQYNALPITKKVLIGAGLLGGSIALAATSGAGIALGAVAVRKFCAGLGGAVTLDAAAEKFFSGRQEKKVSAEIETFIENEEQASPEEFTKRLTEFLDLDNQSIDKQIDKKRRKTFFRKWSLRIGGAFGGIALTNYLATAHEAATVVTPGTDTVVGSGVKVPLPINEPTMSYDQMGGGATPEVPIPDATETVSETSTLPETYQLTAADSQKGLWGVLEKSLPSDMEEAKKTKALTSLQKLIATKLETLSLDDRSALGFRSGDINTIYVGDTLKLNGLVTQAELQDILDGKEIPAVATDIQATEIATTSPLEGQNLAGLGEDTKIDLVDTSQRESVAMSEGSSVQTVETEISSEPVDGTAKLLGEGRVERAVYYRELEDTRKTIFATNNLRFRDSIINAPTVKMSDVLLAASRPGESLIENRAVFGTDQIQRMGKYKELAVNAFGKVAEPGRNETVADYTRRVVTLGFESPENKFNLDKLIRV